MSEIAYIVLMGSIQSYVKVIFVDFNQRCARAGLDQNPPVVENFGKPPCPAKPDPLSPREARRNFLGFFREFSGKFPVF